MDKKVIYKITNNINNKIYIGQTNDFNRRVREHKNLMYGNCEKHLYNAMRKYGVENFDFVIIEETENYNEREQYWIAYYNATDSQYGYNVLSGVHNTNELRNKLTQQELNEIYDLLANSDLSYQEIAEKYNLKSYRNIVEINKGIHYKQQNKQYPIRKMRNDIAHERADKIIEDLQNTNLLFWEIAEKYNCSTTLVSNINTGTRCVKKDIQYPIRKNTKTIRPISDEELQSIYYDIIYTSLKWTELAEKYDRDTKIFQHINQGKTHYNEQFSYPLRKGQNKKGADKVTAIIQDLKNPSLLIKDIAQKHGCCTATVSKINKGLVHKQDNETYPIR